MSVKGRMIDPEMWEDDFFVELSLFERLVWVGVLTGEPDDQGRFQDRAMLIRSHLFPDDDIDVQTINAALEKFSAAGKILRYEKGGKKLIQIVHWWKYQAMRWAGPSKYPAPDGWTDRERYHGQGKVIIERNWRSKGGFPEDYSEVNTIDCTEGCTEVFTTHDVNDDVKGKGKGEGEGEGDVDVPATGAGIVNDPENVWVSQKGVITQFEQISGLTAPIGLTKVMDKWFDSLVRLQNMGATPEIWRQAVDELTAKRYRIAGPWSIEKPCAMILAERKRETIPKSERKRDSSGEFGEFIQH